MCQLGAAAAGLWAGRRGWALPADAALWAAAGLAAWLAPGVEAIQTLLSDSKKERS